MAISIRSVIVGFMSLMVYYAFYYIMQPFLNTFMTNSSNAFNILIVAGIRIILFGVIVGGIFTGSEGEYWEGRM